MSGLVWRVVGGADRGGVMVRHGKALSSGLLPGRLSTGARVGQLELAGARLHYRRLEGAGPEEGWVSIRTAEGKALLELEEPAAVERVLPKWTEPTDEREWQNILSPVEYDILRLGGTDMTGSHSYVRFFPKDGYFACAGCALPLYSSRAKFKDDGWPAWDKCFYSEELGCHVGAEGCGIIEHHCARCQGHLGHIFFGECRTRTNERH